jgi:hypothetical protein
LPAGAVLIAAVTRIQRTKIRPHRVVRSRRPQCGATGKPRAERQADVCAGPLGERMGRRVGRQPRGGRLLAQPRSQTGPQGGSKCPLTHSHALTRRPIRVPLTRAERPRRIHLHPARVLQRRMPLHPPHLPYHAVCRLPHHLALHLRHALDEWRVQPRRHQLDRAGPADLKLPIGRRPGHA